MLLAGNHEQKMFANIFFSQNEQKMFANENCFIGGLVWLSMALFDLLYYGILWPFYGISWLSYGPPRQNVDLTGLISSFRAVIDLDSFGLVLQNFGFSMYFRMIWILPCMTKQVNCPNCLQITDFFCHEAPFFLYCRKIRCIRWSKIEI